MLFWESSILISSPRSIKNYSHPKTFTRPYSNRKTFSQWLSIDVTGSSIFAAWFWASWSRWTNHNGWTYWVLSFIIFECPPFALSYIAILCRLLVLCILVISKHRPIHWWLSFTTWKIHARWAQEAASESAWNMFLSLILVLEMKEDHQRCDVDSIPLHLCLFRQLLFILL